MRATRRRSSSNGLTADVLEPTACFVRLWRKLGWNIIDVIGLCARLRRSRRARLTNELLVRIEHLQRLRAQLADQRVTGARGVDADRHGCTRIRCTRACSTTPLCSSLRMRPSGCDPTAGNWRTHASRRGSRGRAPGRVPARCRVVALLLPKTDGALSLANLSLLYRHARLAQQPGLTVPNLSDRDRPHGHRSVRATTPRYAAIRRDSRGDPASAFDLPNSTTCCATDSAQQRRSCRLDVCRKAVVLRRICWGRLRQWPLTLGSPTQRGHRSRLGGDRVSADVTGRLLDGSCTAARPRLQRFLELSAIAAEPSPNRCEPQFETLEQLTKIASIVQTLRLPGSRLPWLFRENAWLVRRRIRSRSLSPAGSR